MKLPFSKREIALVALGCAGFFVVLLGFILIRPQQSTNNTTQPADTNIIPSPLTTEINLKPLESKKILENSYHVFQSFNNCGPAALSMALSYYGINKSQQELGQELRPYQNPGGDNDDKSVTLEELANKGQELGFIPYHRPNGNTQLLKQFINNDIPVITRTWLKDNEDIGHYRVVKGFDNTTDELIQDDSLQGKNLRYSFADFNTIWNKFNNEYLVLVPQEKQAVAEAILKEDIDTLTAWKKAVKSSEEKLKTNPNDATERFNLSVALYNTGDYKRSAEEFEKVENQLPFRTMWYQIEPIKAYYELGNYNRVFEITNKILNNHNRAFSELYVIKGNIYKNQGNIEAAKREYEQAVLYNSNLKSAQEALSSIQ